MGALGNCKTEDHIIIILHFAEKIAAMKANLRGGKEERKSG